MKIIKLQFLILVLVLFTANSAFADSIFIVSIDTSSLSDTDGYLYFQYLPVAAVNSTAIVSSFSGGILAPGGPTFNASTLGGSSGTLPGAVTFDTVNNSTDYNHGIAFGNSLNFLLTFSDLAAGGDPFGSSTFSLGLFQDEFGATPLLGGTLFTTSLMNNGSFLTEVIANEAVVTPEAGSIWLLGSGLVGLIGIGRKIRI